MTLDGSVQSPQTCKQSVQSHLDAVSSGITIGIRDTSLDKLAKDYVFDLGQSLADQHLAKKLKTDAHRRKKRFGCLATCRRRWSRLSKQSKVLIVAAIALCILTAVLVPVLLDVFTPVVQVTLLTANTKQVFIDRVVSRFNAEKFKTTDGHIIRVVAVHNNSQLRSDFTPALWSPASIEWVEQQNEQQVAVSDLNQLCRYSCSIPVGVAMWRVQAELLGWPSKPIQYNDLFEMMKQPQAWSKYNSQGQLQDDWLWMKYGHGHPKFSNSGRLSLVAVLNALGKDACSTDLPSRMTLDTLQQCNADEIFRNFSKYNYHVGRIDTDVLDRMVLHGPALLSAVANYEANVLRYNDENLTGPWRGTGGLAMVYPQEGVVINEHPVCFVDGAPWNQGQAAARLREASLLFNEFITAPAQQDLACTSYVRPWRNSTQCSAVEGNKLRLDLGAIPGAHNQLYQPGLTVIDNITQRWMGPTARQPSYTLLLLDWSLTNLNLKLQSSGQINTPSLHSKLQDAVEGIFNMSPTDDCLSVALFTDRIWLPSLGDDSLEPGAPVCNNDTLKAALLSAANASLANPNQTLSDVRSALNASLLELKAISRQQRDISYRYNIVVVVCGEDTVPAPSAEQVREFTSLAGQGVDAVKLWGLSLVMDEALRPSATLAALAPAANGYYFYSTVNNYSIALAELMMGVCRCKLIP